MLIIFDVSEENKGFYEGLMTTMVYIGSFLGGLGASFFRCFSLRFGIYLADITMILGSFLEMSENIELFLLGRLIAGLGCGFTIAFVPVFIK